MDKALRTMMDNMPEKTGKPLKEWKNLLQSNAFDKPCPNEFVQTGRSGCQIFEGRAWSNSLIYKCDSSSFQRSKSI